MVVVGLFVLCNGIGRVIGMFLGSEATLKDLLAFLAFGLFVTVFGLAFLLLPAWIYRRKLRRAQLGIPGKER